MKKYIFFFVFCCLQCYGQNATLVKDITPGASSSFADPSSKIVEHLGDKLLFNIVSGHISNLYVTEGTALSTYLLQAASNNQQFFGYFTKTNNNRIAYTMTDYSNNTWKLYTTDGNTIKLMDKHNSIKPIYNLKAYGNYLYYISDKELRRIDLSNTVDELVFAETDNLFEFYLEPDFNTLYYIKYSTNDDTLFVGDINSHNKTNLGSIGQLLVRDVTFTKINNHLVFGAIQNPSSGGTRIYSTDGTLTGTILLATTFHAFFTPVVHESRLYVMNTSDLNGFVTDGTMQGTADFQGFYAYSFIEFNSELYFVGYPPQSSRNGNLLLNRDGTQAGGDQDENGYVYYVYHTFSNEPVSVTVNGKLYTAGTYSKLGGDLEIGLEIMEIKPDPSLPVYERYTFYETKPGAESIYYKGLYATDSKIFFIGNEASTGLELYTLNTSTPTVLSVKNGNAQKQLLDFYPNPASDILHLNYTGTDPILSIRLRSLSGQLMQTYEPLETLDISAVEPGMYFLEVEGRDGSQVLKVVKK